MSSSCSFVNSSAFWFWPCSLSLKSGCRWVHLTFCILPSLSSSVSFLLWTYSSCFMISLLSLNSWPVLHLAHLKVVGGVMPVVKNLNVHVEHGWCSLQAHMGHPHGGRFFLHNKDQKGFLIWESSCYSTYSSSIWIFKTVLINFLFFYDVPIHIYSYFWCKIFIAWCVDWGTFGTTFSTTTHSD